VIGAANSSGTGYFVLAGGEASYSIDAAAYKLNSATADCSTSEFVTAPFTAGSSPPTTAVPEILEFTGCD
jgi:hypothetical protein